jgi:hypothetical protein
VADIKGRANTEAQKRQIMARLLDVWLRNPELRLGQLLYVGHGGPGYWLFDVEDFPLVTNTEERFKPDGR